MQIEIPDGSKHILVLNEDDTVTQYNIVKEVTYKLVPTNTANTADNFKIVPSSVVYSDDKYEWNPSYDDPEAVGNYRG